MARRAAVDECSNCRYWDPRDRNLGPAAKKDGLGVCRIQSYPDEFPANDAAFVDDDAAVLVTAPQFFCNLYKVGR